MASVCFIMQKTAKGVEAVAGINNLPGENATALYERAKRECKEGQSPSAVYSQFRSIPASLLGLAMAKAARENWSGLTACDKFGIATTYIPAWNSAAKAVGVKHEFTTQAATTDTAFNFSTTPETAPETPAPVAETPSETPAPETGKGKAR
jgi:hypothetical protein